VRWQIHAVAKERRLVALLARLNSDNTAFRDFYVLPKIDRKGRFTITHNDHWLETGELLMDLSSFPDAVERAHKARAAES
jgi:hypothetical protein